MRRHYRLAFLGAILLGLFFPSFRVQADSESLPVSRLAGTWENSYGDRYRIAADGTVYRNDDEEVYARFPSDRIDSLSDGTYFAGLSEVTAKSINGTGFQYAPANASVEERLFIGGQPVPMEGGANPNLYFRVDEKDSPSPWNTQKGLELQKFIDDWSLKMKQKGYRKLVFEEGPISIAWQDRNLDAVFSHTGESDSDYTVVAAYAYDRGNGLYHIYHFSLLSDGSPTIIYSEKTMGYAGTRTGGTTYIVSKLSTENSDLKKGFSAILNN